VFKFFEYLILGYLIYIFLRNIFGRFFITQGKQDTGNFRQDNNNNRPYNEPSNPGKKYGATRVDHIPQEENRHNSNIDDDGEYIDYKEVK
jgi:hypothetical protein